MKLRRVTISLDPDVDNDLKYVSHRLGITKSGLVSDLLFEAVGHMAIMLRAIPEDATNLGANEVKRMRGLSADLVREQIQKVRDLDDDLFRDM